LPGRCLYPLASGLLLLAFNRPAAADETRRIGIVVTVQVNVSAELADRLATELGDALRAERPVDVIAGRETTRRLPPEGLADDCVARSDCRNELGRRLDADELLLLVLVELGDRIQIDATWANVASGKVTSRPQIVLEPGADRRQVFIDAAPLLLPHIKKPRFEVSPDIVIVRQAAGSASPGRHMTTATWIASGVAAGALVGAAVFALSAQRKFSTLENDGCRDMACDVNEIDSLRRHSLAADVLFAVAATGAATALVLYLRSADDAPREPASQPGTLRVGKGPGTVGVQIGVTF
jgi:hypothetical protein